MQDMLREFGGEPLNSPQDSDDKPPGPPQRPDKIPIPDQVSESRPRLPSLKPDLGTDRRTSHSSMPSVNVNHDAADNAIIGLQGFKPPPHETQANDWANHPKALTDWQLVEKPGVKRNFHMHSSHNRPKQSTQDDINVRRQSDSRHGEKDHMLKQNMRDIDSLRKQLSEANARVEQAERVSHQLQHQLHEYKAKHNSADVTTGSDASHDGVDRLRRENRNLKAELDDARSHIFSLQPYRKDLTPEEVGRKFDELVSNVTDWVTKFVEPVLDDPARMEEIMNLVKKKPGEVQKLKKHIQNHADLTNGCLFPETDVDIIIAIVTRFLHDHVFQKVLCGISPGLLEAITYVETSMLSNVEPKRDLYALRSWRAESLNAVICSGEYQRHRGPRLKELTTELASIFRPLRREREWSRFCISCLETVIRPAVELQEQLVTSTHHFYLDLNPYAVFNHRQEAEMSPDFMDNLSKLKCENILQNRRPFILSKLNPVPTREELCEDLVNVATIVPGLYLRQVGKGDAIKPPIVVRAQQVLVAWGTQEQREKFVNSNERTLMSQIFYLTRDRGLDGVFQWKNALPWGQ